MKEKENGNGQLRSSWISYIMIRSYLDSSINNFDVIISMWNFSRVHWSVQLAVIFRNESKR